MFSSQCCILLKVQRLVCFYGMWLLISKRSIIYLFFSDLGRNPNGVPLTTGLIYCQRSFRHIINCSLLSFYVDLWSYCLLVTRANISAPFTVDQCSECGACLFGNARLHYLIIYMEDGIIRLKIKLVPHSNELYHLKTGIFVD